MTACSQIALIMNLLGTVPIGVIPVVGMVTAFGGPIVFKNKWWRLSWYASWLVFVVGVALPPFACRLC